MKSIYAASIVLITISSAPADAAWQYTKWGMTVAQAQKASKGVATPTNGQTIDGETVELTAPYASGSFKFTASFWFDQSGRLTSVGLDLVSGDYHELVGALRGKYGEPVNHTPGYIDAYMWRTATDQIGLMNNGQKINLTYSPRVTASGKGL